MNIQKKEENILLLKLYYFASYFFINNSMALKLIYINRGQVKYEIIDTKCVITKKLIDVCFVRIHLLGRNLTLVNLFPSVPNISKNKWDKKRYITHCS